LRFRVEGVGLDCVCGIVDRFGVEGGGLDCVVCRVLVLSGNYRLLDILISVQFVGYRVLSRNYRLRDVVTLLLQQQLLLLLE
jgi:hypothetical protein